MEVSAKTGSHIKEFFKDLAFMVAGGKKTNDDASISKKSIQPKDAN
jgi:hypothetical protein